jgi:hypothetical protein
MSMSVSDMSMFMFMSMSMAMCLYMFMFTCEFAMLISMDNFQLAALKSRRITSKVSYVEKQAKFRYSALRISKQITFHNLFSQGSSTNNFQRLLYLYPFPSPNQRKYVVLNESNWPSSARVYLSEYTARDIIHKNFHRWKVIKCV